MTQQPPRFNASSVHDHIIRIRHRYLKDLDGRILDHGFGQGETSCYFLHEGFDVYGAEISAAALEGLYATAGETGLKQDNFKLLRDGDTTLPFPDNYFSAVVSNQVLYFLEGRDAIDATIREFARTLRSGGKLACTVMAEDNYFFTEYGVAPLPARGMVDVKMTGRVSGDYRLYRFRDEADVRELFEQAGLTVDDLGYFDFKLLDVSCAKHYIVLARKPG